MINFSTRVNKLTVSVVMDALSFSKKSYLSI